MKFDIKCVREFLKENGFVFTVRSYDYGELSYKTIENIGSVFVTRIKQVYIPEDLKNYVMKSGFYKSIDWNVDMGEKYAIDWWEVIERFCKGKPKYLYLVVKE